MNKLHCFLASVCLLCAMVFCSQDVAFSQSAHQKLLIIDKEMPAWPLVSSSAEPWSRAGWQVTYRRFHPYLLRSDLQDYDAVMVLAGRTPILPGVQLSRQDLQMLAAMHQAGKGLVLGFTQTQPGKGAYDRLAMNQLLRDLGVQVQIAENVLIESKHRYPATLGSYSFARRHAEWRYNTIARVPMGDLLPLKVLPDANVEVITETYPSTVFQKGSVRFPGPYVTSAFLKGQAPVLLMPRRLLSISGPAAVSNIQPVLAPALIDSTKSFLVDVARRFSKLMDGAALQVTPTLTTDAMPARSSTLLSDMRIFDAMPGSEYLPSQPKIFNGNDFPSIGELASQRLAYRRTLAGQNIAGYLSDGMTVMAGRLSALKTDAKTVIAEKSPQDLQTTQAIMQQAGIDILWASAIPGDIAGSHDAPQASQAAALGLARRASTLLQKQGAWFAGVDSRDLRGNGGKLIALDGSSQQTWSPLDRGHWRKQLIEPLYGMARVLKSDGSGLRGIIIDTDLYGQSPAQRFSMAHEFSGYAFKLFLEMNRGLLGDDLIFEAQNISPEKYFAFLLENGLLRCYYETLTLEVERMARQLRRDVERNSGEIIWGIYAAQLPGDWYTQGLLRGLSSAGRPALVLSFEPTAGAALSVLRSEEDIHALHLMAITPYQYAAGDYKTLLPWLRRHNDGYWVSTLEAILQPEGVRTRTGVITPEAWARAIAAGWKLAN